MKIGICGLTNSGKSTFLKLVSRIENLIAPYPFSTLKPQEAIAPVINEELKILHSITQTQELIPPYLTFIDVPGLVRGAHQGEGLGNEFLSYLRGCDVILEIVRNFQREDVPHPEGSIDVLRDIDIVENEIIESDKYVIERAIKKLEKNVKEEKTVALLKELKNFLDKKSDRLILDKTKYENLKNFNLLILKDWFLLINGEDIKIDNQFFKNIYNLDLKWELDVLENNLEEFPSKIQDFLNQLRKDLDLIQFFTFTNEITQGWFIKKGSKIIEAAELVHSDFALKFKIAEVINLKDFVKIKKWEKAKEIGLVKFRGRDSLVEENDIILIKI